ncbi:hypothetical protein HZS61_013733 [Fusarium oxysporum f. sp. conglutinans]|uniref:HECT-type E3 ubiquitin transferase n=1 Tax=Fusarium oxysporum f. sp. conglutinans TaxID=100902 RepID=A0A8H6GRH8_FUSOX|nr:hypothetical protein HZS61_013733 [Fusarium oxysporum f. sp. conglutinans]
MAPWSSRRGSQPNNNSNGDLISRIHNTALHTPTTLPALYSTNLPNTSNGNRLELSFSNANADSSSDESDLHPSRPQSSKPRRPQHTRSMSQPFPSLFSSKKKRQNSVGAPPPDLGFADDDSAMPRQAPKTHARNPSHTRNGPVGSKDFTTGNCMTCGSLVRWPRELKVFKCTICTTVNDLEPLSADHDGSKSRRDASQDPTHSVPTRGPHISIEQTKRLVQQSIQSFLSKKLHSIPEPPIEAPPQPPPQSKLSFSSRMQAAGQSLAPVDFRQEAAPSSESPTIQVSHYAFDEEPTLRSSPARPNPTPMRSFSSSYTERPPVRKILQERGPKEPKEQRKLPDQSEGDPKRIFKALEDYIVACFGSFECINSSFLTHTHRQPIRCRSESTRRKPILPSEPREQRGHRREPSGNHAAREPREEQFTPQFEDGSCDLDPKLLLLGDFAENGTWWMGNQEDSRPRRPSTNRVERSFSSAPVNTKTPQMSWGDLIKCRRNEESPSGSAEGRSNVHSHGQILPTSDFYNSMIDYTDLVADFENWEARRSKFTFCQYPFLLSIWAKNHILEHDARRQMQSKARDAFFDSIMSRKAINQFLELTVRRDCLVDDSLKAVSEVIGSGSEDIKKGLRITFSGEEGVDAGGLRKEWFLLLAREVFNPDHGLFLYDEDSQYCYFNPNAFETSDQFFLVGVVMGLAIYNSTILDVALPPFAFRKLIASAPTHGTGASAHPRPPMRYTLEDLAEYRPRLARGLRQLLEYEGNVEDTFCLDFVIDMDKYGTQVQVPLCPGGERIPVTNNNRREYVDLYVRYIIDVSVTRQFEPFKRGFYTVCGGNALSLFRPEEIELLVRGSDESLDINSLRGVAEYDNWGTKKPDGSEPVIDWFWETFQAATSQDQRKLLLFITGSDRIPAMGAAVLPIKISCLGEDEGRFPIARTCFNMLSLSRYKSKERLEKLLWTAVHESEGFGIK